VNLFQLMKELKHRAVLPREPLPAQPRKYRSPRTARISPRSKLNADRKYRHPSCKDSTPVSITLIVGNPLGSIRPSHEHHR
jgi:hypothetical protein